MKKVFFTLTEDEIENLVERITNNLKKSYESEHRNQEDELLTIDEAAKFVKLSKPTLYGLVHKKSIPYNKKGKRLYFQKAELLDWIKSGKRETKSSLQSKADLYLSKNRLA